MRQLQKRFILGCDELASYGAQFGIKVLVENNVCTKANYSKHNCSPFIFSGFHESIKFVESLPRDCGVLLDIGHLNVSSKTMSYDGDVLIKEIQNRINAFHLSHNEGLVDSNKPLKDNTPYLSYVKKIDKFLA